MIKYSLYTIRNSKGDQTYIKIIQMVSIQMVQMVSSKIDEITNHGAANIQQHFRAGILNLAELQSQVFSRHFT